MYCTELYKLFFSFFVSKTLHAKYYLPLLTYFEICKIKKKPLKLAVHKMLIIRSLDFGEN